MSKPAKPRRPLRIGLFGGTFDPIHNGHLAVARAARRRLHLDGIYFIPCGRPPHKDRPGLSSYLHRFAMVALVCAGEPGFWPSLLEAGPDLRGRRRYYTVDTVRRLRRQLGSRARLYFLLGADAYLYLPAWKKFRQLVRLCEFIVAARPGFSLRQARVSAPAAAIHLLPGVRVNISATEIRRAVRRGRGLGGKVPPTVADYIEKMRLYQRGQ